MEEELITSVSEERIAAFEKKREEKKQNERQSFIFRLVIFLVVLISLCISPFLPVFSARNTIVHGNHLLTTEEILSYGGYKKSTSLLWIDAKKLENAMKSKEYIADCSITWKPIGLDIEMDEIAVCLKEEKDGQIRYYLSNDTYLSDFKEKYPSSTYDFKEDEVPLTLSSVSFKTPLGVEEVEDVERRKKLFSHIKEIDASVLKSATYFEIVYSKNKENLFFAFYFPSDNHLFHRILLRDETFSYFLKETRWKKIMASITSYVLSNSNDILIQNHDTINELKYTSTVCTYSGNENECMISTK